MRSGPLRVVLDTNVLVSALLFNQGRLSWLRPCWHQGQLTPVLAEPTVRELLRVLAYPKFRLQAAERERLLEDLLLQGGTVLDHVVWKPTDEIGREHRTPLNFTERGYGLRAPVGVSDRAHSAASASSGGSGRQRSRRKGGTSFGSSMQAARRSMACRSGMRSPTSSRSRSTLT